MKYPAKYLVHTVQGPEPCCADHAIAVENIMLFMGACVHTTIAPDGAECNNCRNEADKGKK